VKNVVKAVNSGKWPFVHQKYPINTSMRARIDWFWKDPNRPKRANSARCLVFFLINALQLQKVGLAADKMKAMRFPAALSQDSRT